MRFATIAFGLASALVVSAPCQTLAADTEAGSSLTPADAAGPWTLESRGRVICVLNLGKTKVGAAGYAVHVPAACGGVLPANVAGWVPSVDGMSLVGADGQNLISFDRWSNSLLVSLRSSAVDVQLRRGGPNP